MNRHISHEIEEAIKNNGLSERETAAYLALLELGRGSADSIAKRAGLKRATAYVALDSLLHQGLALKVPRARKMIFIAKHPEELLQRSRERLLKLESLIPSLRLHTAGASQFNTVLYEGIPGIKNAYWYKLDDMRDTEYRAFFGIAQNIDSQLKNVIAQWNKANAKRNIRAKAIAPIHHSLKEFREADASLLRDVRTIPFETYPSTNSLEIYDQFVRIVMFDELAAVIIESPALAQSLGSVHEMIWKTLK